MGVSQSERSFRGVYWPALRNVTGGAGHQGSKTNCVKYFMDSPLSCRKHYHVHYLLAIRRTAGVQQRHHIEGTCQNIISCASQSSSCRILLILSLQERTVPNQNCVLRSEIISLCLVLCFLFEIHVCPFDDSNTTFVSFQCRCIVTCQVHAKYRLWRRGLYH